MTNRRFVDLLKRLRRARLGIAAVVAVFLIFLASGALAEPVFVAVGLGVAIFAFLYSDRHSSLRERLDIRFPEQDRIDPLSVARSIAATLPDPLILLDAAGRIIFQNQRAEQVLGRHEQTVHISSVVRAPQVLEALRRVRVTGEAANVDYYLPVPTKRHFEVLIAPVAVPIDGEDDRHEPHLLVLMHDLTQAERVERMRADFVANAGHELRTPLASLIGFIETLQGSARQDPEARDRFLSIMQVEARRMSRLIDDLLSLTRIELNAHLQPTEDVDISSVIGHVINALSPLAGESGVRIECVQSGGPFIVCGDRDELAQVFQNLLENAIKYGQSGGRVDVEIGQAVINLLGAATTGVAISVRDHGPGIAPEHLPRLTERFYRVDAAHSRDKGGTGLGLAIVKHILNRHRGELAISSVLGSGSTFTVHLPLDDKSSEQQR